MLAKVAIIVDYYKFLINKCRENAIYNLVITLYKTRGAFLDGTRGCYFKCRSNLLLLKPKAPFLNLNYNDLVQTVLAFKSLR
ncbi:hypothetical protein N7467_011858 [Penicillium canescens]|nr:hypothetical protein N7467_011858 [Penicillium canescens]